MNELTTFLLSLLALACLIINSLAGLFTLAAFLIGMNYALHSTVNKELGYE